PMSSGSIATGAPLLCCALTQANEASRTLASAANEPRLGLTPNFTCSSSSPALLGGSRRSEDVAQDFIVAFVARVLVQARVALFQLNDRRPRLRPHRRVVDLDLVVDAVGRDACEAFDELQVVGGSHEVALARV